jgi:hypothetical protein
MFVSKQKRYRDNRPARGSAVAWIHTIAVCFDCIGCGRLSFASSDVDATGVSDANATDSAAAGSNLIIDGDFPAKLVTFNTSYTIYIPTSPPNAPPSSHVALVTSSPLAHENYLAVVEHSQTTNSRMAVFNGRLTSDLTPENMSFAAWCQLVTLKPLHRYRASLFASSVSTSTEFPALELKINDDTIKTPQQLVSKDWVEVFTEFQSDQNVGSVNFCIYDANTTGSFGNDFAIDDISLVEMP